MEKKKEKSRQFKSDAKIKRKMTTKKKDKCQHK